MKTSLYTKIILILVLFIIIVMAFSAVVLINSVTNFYQRDFYEQMDSAIGPDSVLREDLTDSLTAKDPKQGMKLTLDSYAGVLGIDNFRNYFVLDELGNYIFGTDDELGISLEKTPNLISALNGKESNERIQGAEYADYTVLISRGTQNYLIYIKDSMDEMSEFMWILLSIIIQSMLLSLVFAIILSFFLSRTITSPIKNLTESAQKLREGDFTHDIEIRSEDEIGILSATFNEMKIALKNTLDVASGERSKLETVFTYLRDAVIAFTDDGRVLHINKSAIELFGKSYNESFTIKSFMKLLKINTPTTHKKSSPTIEPMMESDVMFNGRVLDINFGTIQYNENNTIHDGYITVIHDITGRYELEKSRREFVANVSHEMRTPLTSIRGACDTMLQNPDMPEEMKNVFLNMALTECDRMTNIVSDLLTLSRLDNDKTRWKISSYSITESLKHVTEVIRVDANAHKHTLSLVALPDIPEIEADKERIEQVLINVLSNSVKYTPDGGNITVKASAIDSQTIEITVADNGIGIPKEDVNRIFERFYRVEKSRTSETGGTGLGLAIAKEIVTAHGGTINIESELGEGTSITIRLPIKTSLKTVD